MATPRQSHHDRLICIGKYMLWRPRYVIKLVDVEGDQDTRNSTSRGLLRLGDHSIKSWSSTRSVIALSTGEAELYVLNKACAGGLGAKSLLSDLGLDLDIGVCPGATAGKASASRRGLGKVRHTGINQLWIQEHVQN